MTGLNAERSIFGIIGDPAMTQLVNNREIPNGELDRLKAVNPGRAVSEQAAAYAALQRGLLPQTPEAVVPSVRKKPEPS